MVKNLRNRLHESKGFSLVELIVVIAIMVILIALLVPNVVGYISKAQDSANLSAAKSIYNAINTAVIDYKAQHGGYPSCSDLATDLTSTYKTNQAEALAIVPSGTAVGVGYDEAGQVWGVAVGSQTGTGTLDATKAKNIQMYSPLYSGNIYDKSGNASKVVSGKTSLIPTDLTCPDDGTNVWTGATSGTDADKVTE